MRKFIPLEGANKMTQPFGSAGRWNPQVRGFVTKADDTAGVPGRPLNRGSNSVPGVNDAMALDYQDSPFSGGYAVIDFDATVEIAGAARVPKSASFYDGGNDRYIPDDEPTLASMIVPFKEKPNAYPYTGNGFLASRDGTLRPEFHLQPDNPNGSNAFDLPAGAVISKYDANGNLLERRRLTRGIDNDGEAFDEWVVIP